MGNNLLFAYYRLENDTLDYDVSRRLSPVVFVST